MESKKVNLKGMYQILITPFYVLGIDTIITVFYYFSVTGVSDINIINRIIRYGTDIRFNWAMFGFIFMIIMFLAWFYPLWQFSRNPTPERKNLIRKKIAFLYKDIFLIFLSVYAAKIATHIIIYRSHIIWTDFLKYNLPAVSIAVVVQFCFAIVFLDNLIFKNSFDFINSLYDKEELYKIKEGFKISISGKIIMLFISTGVIPILLLYLYIRNSFAVTGDQIDAINNLILIGSFTPMVLGLAFIVSSFQKPIEGLTEKMKKLSDGDFDVKSRIYFTDEIASIKAHFNVMADQLKERELLRETFGKYVSIEVVRELLKSGKMDLGGEEVEASVLFCDIRNFTGISEKISAKEVVEMLNSYFSYVTAPIIENHGIVNKFIGDAVMAIYIPALGSTDHVRDAVVSAIKMRSALADFNKNGIKPAGELKFGIGIHTGTLVAGNIGTSSRLEYTVIGDTVNIASRVESKTKDYGADILLTSSVYNKISKSMAGVSFEKAGEAKLKGKDEAVEVYRIL